MANRDSKGLFIKGHKSFKTITLIDRFCLFCNNTFKIRPYRTQKYCSKECRKSNAKNTHINSGCFQKVINKEIAKNHPNWKGGISLNENEYRKYKKETDVNFKLRVILRSRLYAALKGNYKVGSAVKDLGCSIEEFKIYLENQFTEGMNWNNYGNWHIDHIRPLISFDLSNRSDFLIACNYKNLQPLWAQDNLKKGIK